MAVAVRSVAVTTADNVTTITVNKPAGTVSGDYLLAVLVQDSDSTTASVSPASGFAAIDGGGQGEAANTTDLRAFGRVAGGAEGASYVFTVSTGASTVLAMLALTGVDTGTPIRVAPVFATGSTTTETLAAISATTPAVDDLYIAAVGDQGGTAPTTVGHTTPSGLTQQVEQPTGWAALSVWTQPVTVAGAIAAKTTTRSQTLSGGSYRTFTMVLAAAAAVQPTVTSIVATPRARFRAVTW